MVLLIMVSTISLFSSLLFPTKGSNSGYMMLNSVLLPNESNQPLVDNLFTKKLFLILILHALLITSTNFTFFQI
ncbi:hypothetical protein BJ165DRAFT_1419452 [Panaeolus papilionaceus]|nr:hypothetical protein BJ165DRAFT_1419452 [Panaeolus papilionaceus]